MKASEYKVSPDKFVFASDKDLLHDQKMQTKPVSYLKDAFYRFKRNHASITAGIIIGILLLFAIIGPFLTNYTVKYTDTYYRNNYPKNELFYNLGIHFWDGGINKESTAQDFYKEYAKGIETGKYAVMNNKYTTYKATTLSKKEVTYYKYRYDSIYSVGVVMIDLQPEEYRNLQDYQDKTGIQVIYPVADQTKLKNNVAQQDMGNVGNFWYQTEIKNTKTTIVFDEDGNFIPIYKAYSGNDDYYSKVRYEEGIKYDYAIKNQTGYSVRVDYYEYYVYMHTEILKDGITKPLFIFGTTNAGQDIFACLANGARFSFILSIIVASINLIVGAIYGAIEGYYGGTIDLVMERIVDILAAIPFIIVITLLKFHYENTSQALLLFISFFLTGWIGMASRTRMQFYRFKNQEYVLAARTLGAKDKRIMFKHIFPNAIGTLITSMILVIPGVIFSETTLTYLGIIDLTTSGTTSVGTLLATGRLYISSYPHMILFPSIFISLLMLSFNLFGNGLRDAFNPSLRGSEE